jgi:hypothetical protein
VAGSGSGLEVNVSKRVAVSAMLVVVLAGPPVALAQIPDLEDKVQDLTAEVRGRGADFRPLYQDTGELKPQQRSPRPHIRRGRLRLGIKPAHATPSGPPHPAPGGSAR